MPRGNMNRSNTVRSIIEQRDNAPRQHRRAGDLTPEDARWVFAVRVADAIDDDRTAALSLERRNRLISIARALGLRPFDANLIIAIVQDAVRNGEGGLGASVAERLGLVRPPARNAIGTPTIVLAAISAIALAAAILTTAIPAFSG